MTEPSFVQLVSEALANANQPLLVAEIITRVEKKRPVSTRNPQATIRNAITNIPLAASLGGRPARYTWWPHHLVENVFRQPLSASDLVTGSLAVGDEVWLALWPDFFVGFWRTSNQVTLDLTDGPSLQAGLKLLETGQGSRGIPPTPALADWYQRQGATTDDDLIVQVVDVDSRHYGLSLVRRADRDETAIAARNQALADAAEGVLRAGQLGMPDFYLIPRLIARDAYRYPLPPDPWPDVLRADLRFVTVEEGADLVEKVVNHLERECTIPPNPHAFPRPRGQRRQTRSDKARQVWGAYLFDRGMDHLWAGWPLAAEAYYKEALRLDPEHADAWVHLANRRFEEDRVAEALLLFERGQAAAEARTIGDPAHYPHSFWGDVDSRPFMRALQGRGLCLWRLGRAEEARRIFVRMLELNPNDNQGARFLLPDLDEGLSWEESMKRDEERFPSRGRCG